MSKTDRQTVGGIRHSARSVLFDFKQYISFFAALFIVQALFWTLLITNETNKVYTHEKLAEDYKYHIIISGLEDEAQLLNYDRLYSDKSELWPEIEKIDMTADDFGTRNYRFGLRLNEADPYGSEGYFWAINSTEMHLHDYTVIKTPLYTEDPEMDMQNRGLFIILGAVCLLLGLGFGGFNKTLKRPKLDDGSGDRVYRSTVSANARIAMQRICFAVMLAFIAAALIFLVIVLSLGNGPAYFFAYLFLILLSIAFLTALFNVRVNHYKFQYGIYMAFGAGFGKLYSTAVREMLIVSGLTAIPSFGVSFLISFLIYSGSAATPKLGVGVFVGLVILNLLVIFASVYLPMKAMAVKPPVTLLYAQDNSNLVVSPRRSRKIFGKRFPRAYELLGIFRFRRYFVKLVAVAVSFTTVFLCGLYLADATDITAGDSFEYTVTPTGTAGLTDDELAVVSDLYSEDETLDYFYWSEETAASALKCHALVHKDNQKYGNNVYNIEDTSRIGSSFINQGYDGTTDAFKFVAYNSSLIDIINENKLFTVEGDLNSVLNDDKTVIISEYINNRECFNFEVGDTIVLVLSNENVGDYDFKLLQTGKREQALASLISQFGGFFDYEVYTVGAIVDYGGSDGNFIVGLNPTAYDKLIAGCGGSEQPVLLQVYTDEAATVSDFERLRKSLETDFSVYGYSVNETFNVVRSQLYGECAHTTIILVVSILVMLVSPLIWFFSQLQFFRRRNKEMFILRSLGAVEKQIRNIYLLSGLIMAALSAVMTLAMSYIADYLIYLVCTAFVSAGATVGGVTVSFYMPPLALLMCLVMAVVCGFLSSWLPFALRRVLKTKAEQYTVDGN